MAQLAWGAATDAGQVRTSNEDQWWADGRVFAVADGMGGHQAGEIASELAIARIMAAFEEPEESADALAEAIDAANRQIFEASTTDPEQHGMGTTVTALALLQSADGSERLVVGNVGDSRTYRVRHGALEQMTVDHSYVQELVAGGHITAAEARNHPRRNIVTRALGIEPEIEVDSWTLDLHRGDRYILCSDGLVDEVPDDEILEIAVAHSDAQRAAQELVDAANAHGGHDNVTVVVVDVLDGDDPPPPPSTPAAEVDSWNETTAEIPQVGDSDDHSDAGDLVTAATIVDGDQPAASNDTVNSADSAGPTDIEATTEPTKRRRRSGLLTFVLGIGAAAVLVFGAAIFAAWARSGYFVDFDETDRVVVYQGQNDSVLWFNPTIRAVTGRTRATLDERSIELVEDRFRFDSLSAAEQFVTERLELAPDETPTRS